jgi:hypothetical protein
LWDGTGEDDKPALVAFQFPVCADGYFGYDEGVAQACEDDWGGGSVAIWWFAP